MRMLFAISLFVLTITTNLYAADAAFAPDNPESMTPSCTNIASPSGLIEFIKADGSASDSLGGAQ